MTENKEAISKLKPYIIVAASIIIILLLGSMLVLNNRKKFTELDSTPETRNLGGMIFSIPQGWEKIKDGYINRYKESDEEYWTTTIFGKGNSRICVYLIKYMGSGVDDERFQGDYKRKLKDEGYHISKASADLINDYHVYITEGTTEAGGVFSDEIKKYKSVVIDSEKDYKLLEFICIYGSENDTEITEDFKEMLRSIKSS